MYKTIASFCVFSINLQIALDLAEDEGRFSGVICIPQRYCNYFEKLVVCFTTFFEILEKQIKKGLYITSTIYMLSGICLYIKSLMINLVRRRSEE